MKLFFKNIFLVGLIFMALLLALEGLYRLLHIPKITHHNIYAKGQELIPEINNNTVLILGDSKMEWGIDPFSILDNFKVSGSNTNVINMAVPGSNGTDILKLLLQEKIYPKLIILGSATNLGAYYNHGFDKLSYTPLNKKIAGAEYFLDEKFYFRDPSVIEYLVHGYPYFKDHQYDALGGAIVTEYGDYTIRTNTQYDMAKDFKKNFKLSALNKYCTETNALLDSFKSKGTIVCGVIMPATKKIYELHYLSSSSQVRVNYNKVYDWSNFTYTNEKAQPDSVYFYDGCHLSHTYATIFSGKLIAHIRNDFPGIK